MLGAGTPGASQAGVLAHSSLSHATSSMSSCDMTSRLRTMVGSTINICSESEEESEGPLKMHSSLSLPSNDSNDSDDIQARLQKRLQKSVQANVHWLVDSTAFNLAISVVVLINIIVMGVQLDLPQYENTWWILENVFTVIFLLEMLVKLAVLQCDYFADRADWLDMTIVIFSVADCWVITPLGGDAGLQKISLFKFLRLFRFVRLAKLVKQVKPLVVVMSGVMEAVISTFWVSLVLLIAVYIGGIFCTEYIGHNAQYYPGYATDPAKIDELEIISQFNPYLCFGDLRRSMLTLFNMSIGGEWQEIIRPVAVKQPLLVFFFMIFVMFVTFGVMNVIVGMIVDNVFKSGVQLQVDAVNSEKARKKAVLKKLQTSLTSLDQTGQGYISVEALKRGLELHDVSSLLEGVQLPDHMAAFELFYMLDCSGDGTLQYSEFTKNFLRLVDSNEFQQLCILQTGINHIKSLVKEVQRDVKRVQGDIMTHVDSHIVRLSKDLEHIVRANGRYGSPTNAASNGHHVTFDGTGVNSHVKEESCLDKSVTQEMKTLFLEVQSNLQAHVETHIHGLGNDLRNYFLVAHAGEKHFSGGVCSTSDNAETGLDNHNMASSYRDRVKLDNIEVGDELQIEESDSENRFAILGSGDYNDSHTHLDSIEEEDESRGDDVPATIDENIDKQNANGERIITSIGPESCELDLDFLKLPDFLEHQVCFQSTGPLGLSLHKDQPQFPVKDLTPGGQASVHGIRVGDRVARIHGVSTNNWTWDEVREAVGKRPLCLTLLRQRDANAC